MKTIAISDIQIVNRQRRHFDEKALQSLAISIQNKGLLQPVVLQNDAVTLVAGERRCRAVASIAELLIGITHDGQAVAEGCVPYVTLGELSEDDLVEAELEENILRENLNWQEEADAIAQLHSLRVAQNPIQTQTDTASEIAGGKATSSEHKKVRESLIIKAHLDDPDVQKAKTKKDAMKIIKKKAEQKLTDQLAENFNIQSTPHVFNCGDFRDFDHFLPTSSVDCILTDPPYGIGADSFGDQAGAEHGYDDTPEYFKEIIEAWANETARVAKPSAHLYAFCDPRYFSHIVDVLKRYGWDCWATPLIWAKGNGMLPQPDFGPRRTYEFIVFANRGQRPVTAVYSDVIGIAGLQAPKYGAEKPVELYHDLLRRSCKPGDTVWDAFAGAGPIFPAANRCSVKVVATELNPDKYNYAKLRMEGEEE